MVALIACMARDAQTNFRLLFRPLEESAAIIDEDGKKRLVSMRISPPENPLTILWEVGLRHWLFFLCGFFAVFADYIDFYLLAIQAKKLAGYFNTLSAWQCQSLPSFSRQLLRTLLALTHRFVA